MAVRLAVALERGYRSRQELKAENISFALSDSPSPPDVR
jgi:hypothetical protein